jgi:uncharacterized metal-binding protein
MTPTSSLTVVVPCSGIGKSLGSVSREAAYELCENLCPTSTRLVALSKLVLGEEEACRLVRQGPVVTIDGCKKMCAASLVRHSNGVVAHEVAVLDVYRRHNHLKPDGIAELNEDGQELAHVLATEIANELDSFEPKGGPHA